MQFTVFVAYSFICQNHHLAFKLIRTFWKCTKTLDRKSCANANVPTCVKGFLIKILSHVFVDLAVSTYWVQKSWRSAGILRFSEWGLSYKQALWLESNGEWKSTATHRPKKQVSQLHECENELRALTQLANYFFGAHLAPIEKTPRISRAHKAFRFK